MLYVNYVRADFIQHFRESLFYFLIIIYFLYGIIIFKRVINFVNIEAVIVTFNNLIFFQGGIIYPVKNAYIMPL